MDNVLLAIDDSEASWRAIEETAAVVRNAPNLRVHLFHAIGPVPASLQEFRGAEDPVEERVLDQDLKRKQDAWLQKARAAGEALLARARRVLIEAGAPPDHITSETAPLLHYQDLAAEILRSARTCACRRIIVGRKSFSWLDELLTDHLGEELKKTADGISVSVC